MEKIIVEQTKGDSNGTIDELIEFLETSKLKGATHYNMRWSNDRNWTFKWFETYQLKSEQEIKNDRIKELEDELKLLKG